MKKFGYAITLTLRIAALKQIKIKPRLTAGAFGMLIFFYISEHPLFSSDNARELSPRMRLVIDLFQRMFRDMRINLRG